jgi:tetratricopeptide (TPR) repeat protein
VNPHRSCRLAAAALLLAVGALSAQERLPAGAEARSLLGQPLTPPPLAPAVREANERSLAEARRAYEHTPDNADSIIWLGRRTAYLGRYREAISIFSEGIRKHPGDARMYRHRGHRYITIRELDQAIVDFDRAVGLTEDEDDQVEPDGLPNARGIPTSTLHSNIRYHLGLAHYLKGEFERAAQIYREDVDAARATKNADMLVASSHWLYMALRRAGKAAEAARVLDPIEPGLDVIENGSYHRLLLLYRGLLPADSLMPKRSGGSATVEDVTTGYGLANWHFYNGRRPEAERLFREIVATPQWAAFGYLAAEAELARLR